jgi:hypothetical protein
MAFPLIAAAMGLAEFAPLIARWLGGEKAHEAAHHVVDVAKNITGAKDPLKAIELLQSNQKMLWDFQRAILSMEADMELTLMKDRESARFRDVELAKVGRSNRRADVMVFCAAGGLVLCLCTLGYYADQLPGEAVGILSTISGIFGACLKDAFAFEFGASREGLREFHAIMKENR